MSSPTALIRSWWWRATAMPAACAGRRGCGRAGERHAAARIETTVTRLCALASSGRGFARRGSVYVADVESAQHPGDRRRQVGPQRRLCRAHDLVRTTLMPARPCAAGPGPVGARQRLGVRAGPLARPQLRSVGHGRRRRRRAAWLVIGWHGVRSALAALDWNEALRPELATLAPRWSPPPPRGERAIAAACTPALSSFTDTTRAQCEYRVSL